MGKLSKESILKINTWYPQLKYDEKNKEITGILSFTCSNNDRKITHYLDSVEVENIPTIHDSYKIKIDLQYSTPKVFDVDKKISKSDIPKIKLHLFSPDNSCCLAFPKKLIYTNIYDFIKDFVVPYFYYHSYYFSHGRYPYEGLPHDINEAKKILIQDVNKPNSIDKISKIGRNATCHCHSGKKYKNCCHSEDELHNRKILSYNNEVLNINSYIKDKSNITTN